MRPSVYNKVDKNVVPEIANHGPPTARGDLSRRRVGFTGTTMDVACAESDEP